MIRLIADLRKVHVALIGFETYFKEVPKTFELDITKRSHLQEEANATRMCVGEIISKLQRKAWINSVLHGTSIIAIIALLGLLATNHRG